MAELFIFLGGAAAGCLATIFWFWKTKPKTEDSTKEEETSAYMQTQYANFFNYDGTSKGQLPLE